MNIKCILTLHQGYLVVALKDKLKYLRNAKPRGKKRPADEEELEKKPRKEYYQFPSVQGT